MNTKKVTPRLPSGFNELLPKNQIIFDYMKDVIKTTFEGLGYLPIETSSIELSEVLLAKGGGETEKQVYRFEKGKKDLTLRYDLTVPLARYVAQNYNELTFPFKRYQIQKVWRAEKAQKGRSREFYQCDVDILGKTSIQADVATVFAVYKALTNLEIPKFTIGINNRKLMREILEKLEVLDMSAEILKIIDKVDKVGFKISEKELNNLIGPEKSKRILDILQVTGSTSDVLPALKNMSLDNSEGFAELSNLYNSLISLGVNPENLLINIRIVRGLDYYTSSVFETTLNDYEKYGSIASGGRYDDLATYYTNQNIPGVGMSIGLTRLYDVLEDIDKLPKIKASTLQVLLCYLDENTKEYSLKILKSLRESGIKADLYLGSNLSLNKQLDYANKIGITYVAIIGEDEVINESVAVKNMKTGDQKLIPWKELSNSLE